MEESPAYGATRQRSANVSYADVERAALDILASERRPSVETVREVLGRGSPATIATFLKRFWRDLGVRAQGDPAALTRLPSEIVEAVEAIWQRALALASQAAKSDDNAARERLEQIRIENDVRAQSFELRETEFETAARERERALIEGRSQLNALMSELASNRATMRAQVARIMDLGVQVEDYRRQLATLIERAVTRNRTLAERKPRPPKRPKPQTKAKRRINPKKPGRRTRPTRRSGGRVPFARRVPVSLRRRGKFPRNSLFRRISDRAA
jgi:hypothetical protein